MVFEAVWEGDEQAGQGRTPVLCGGALDQLAGGGFALAAWGAFLLGADSNPLVLDVADREPQQLDDRVVVGSAPGS